MKTLRLAILGSTQGTDMLALIEAIQQKRLNASIELVISDQAQALILQRARAKNLTTLFIDPQSKTREAFDRELSSLLMAANIDLIVLIGFMRILSSSFVKHWKDQIINVHPSLLPAFAGGMDKNVHQAVLDAGVQETGCTVHRVTEQVDQGPILVQKKCAVRGEDTVDSLKARVQALEGLALIEAIHNLNPTNQQASHES